MTIFYHEYLLGINVKQKRVYYRLNSKVKEEK